jgi:hypothetical protein
VTLRVVWDSLSSRSFSLIKIHCLHSMRLPTANIMWKMQSSNRVFNWATYMDVGANSRWRCVQAGNCFGMFVSSHCHCCTLITLWCALFTARLITDLPRNRWRQTELSSATDRQSILYQSTAPVRCKNPAQWRWITAPGCINNRRNQLQTFTAEKWSVSILSSQNQLEATLKAHESTSSARSILYCKCMHTCVQMLQLNSRDKHAYCSQSSLVNTSEST